MPTICAYFRDAGWALQGGRRIARCAALAAPASLAAVLYGGNTMDFSRRYLVWALCYAAAGMVLGLYMAASHNHGQLVTHAHVLMVGFVLSLVYGLIHRLWLQAPARALATTQFVLHQAAAATLCVGLFLLYGGKTPESTIAPVLGAGSIGVLAALLLMLYLVLRPATAPRTQAGDATI